MLETITFKISAFIGLLSAACVILFCFWEGMNGELCKRRYDPPVYQEMKLDCNRYN